MTTRPRLVVGDSHRVFTAGLEHLLGGECEVVSTPPGTQALLDEVRRLRPELVVTGLTPDAASGLDVLQAIHERAPETRIVVLTVWGDGTLAAEAFRRGASAYVLHSSDPSELIEALRASLAGRAYISSNVTGDAIHSLLAGGPDADADLLTPSQRDVVRRLAEGKSMKEVAAALKITPRTVAFHKYRVMQKFNIRSSAELVRFAMKQGIV